jgi:hypothetical protein
MNKSYPKTSVQAPPKKKQKTSMESSMVSLKQDKEQLEMYMQMYKQTCDWLRARGSTDGNLQGYNNGYNPENFIPAVDLEDLSLLHKDYQQEYHTGFFKGYLEGYNQGFSKRTLEQEEANKKTLEHMQSVGHDDTDAWEQLLKLDEPIMVAAPETQSDKMGVSFLTVV